MAYRFDDQQNRRQLLTIVDRGSPEQLFTFLQGFHRRPFPSLADVMEYTGVIDDQIDFIDCTGTKYNVTPLIIAAGKGSYEKVKILLVHGANPNKQCTTGDTALNLAVHRQKHRVVDLLLQYHANPNIFNQAGKTALHRAVISYTDDNINRIRALLDAKADLQLEDRNQRTPLDEAVFANRPEVVDVLLSHDRTLVEHAYRAAIIASRLGYDKCLEVLLNYGMNPNIADRTNTTPLHVAVRSMKLPIVRLLIANGADPNKVNNRGETPVAIAEYLQPDQQQNFTTALAQPAQKSLSDFHSSRGGKTISYVYPLLHSRSNWTLDSDEFRSSTAENSSVQYLLDASNGTYWHCKQSKNAWVIFDLKHQYNISGVRIIGCDNHSTPKNGHLDVSNALNGPWLKVKDFNCVLTQGNKNDFLFSPLETRYIRVFILDNYGGEDIRIQGIGFFGLDMRLVTLLKEYSLENSLHTLLSNDINDLETLYENQDEILNSSDKYLDVNDHFQFIRLTESLKSPHLTHLEWFNLPQTTVIAGDKLHTFSVAANEGVTDRVKLEEQLENSPQVNTVLMKDLEPIQGRSLVDFSDYTIKTAGRYKIRVVSVESPDIHTPWQEIVVGSTSPYAHTLNNEGDELPYLSSTTHFVNDTTSDKENASFSQIKSTTSLPNKDNRGFVAEVYESESDDTGDDTCLISLKSIEESPYNFSLTNMSYTTDSAFVDYRPEKPEKLEHYTQTKQIDYYDHSTNTDEDLDEGYNSSSRLNSKPSTEIHLTPTKYRSVLRTPLSNIFPYSNTNSQKQSEDDEALNYGEKIIIPTKYRLLHERLNRLRNGGYTSRSQEPIKQHSPSPQRQSHHRESPQQYYGKRNQPLEEPVRQKQQQQQSDDDEGLNYGEKIIIPTKYRLLHEHVHKSPTDENRNRSRQQSETRTELKSPYQQRQSQNEEPPRQNQSQHYRRQQPRKRTLSVEEPTRKPPPQQQQQSQYRSRHQSQQRHETPRESSPEEPKQPSQYHPRHQSQQQHEAQRESLPEEPKQPSQHHPKRQSQHRSRSPRDSSPDQDQPSHYYELNQSQNRTGSPRESPVRQQKPSSQKPTGSDDESSEEKSEYYGQGKSQTQNIRPPNLSSSSPPIKQQSQYERTKHLRQQNGSAREPSPSQQQEHRQSNYYEISVSSKPDQPVRESSSRQQQQQPSSRKQTDSDDESPERQSEYFGQGQSKKQIVRQNPLSSPPPETQRQSADYYEIASPPRANEPVRQSPPQQQQSHQRSDSGLHTPPPKTQQQAQKRNQAEYGSPHLPPTTNKPPRTQVDSDEESTSQRHQYQISLENMEQGVWKPLYNRYRIIAGDFELTESPSDNNTNPSQSKSGQMQLVFKAILQGDKVQERAQNSIHDSDAGETRTQTISSAIHQTNFHRTSYPNSRQSPINEDRENQDSASKPYETRSNYQPRTNLNLNRDQLTPERQTRDQDKQTNVVHDPSRQPASSSNALKTRQSQRDSNQDANDQLPIDDHPAPSNRNSRTENDDDIDGIHERSRSSSRHQKSSKYEQSPLKKTDHSRSSPLLTSPKTSPKSSESKNKYFFGENVQNPAPDEDSDEADCETFGHNSQPQPLTNTSAKRNLEYPSETASPFHPYENQNSGNLRFGQQTDVGTVTGNSLTQQNLSSTDQSTVRKTEDSLPHSQIYAPNKQTSSQATYEVPDAYTAPPSTSLNQNFSNASTTGFPQQYPDESNHYKQINPGHVLTSGQPKRYDDKDSSDEVDDPENDDPVEYEDDDDQHDRIPDSSDGPQYINDDDDDEPDNLPRDDDSNRTSEPPQSGVEQLMRQNPVRDVSTDFQPMQYPETYAGTSTRPGTNNIPETNSKKGFFSFLGGSKNKGADKNKGKSTQSKKPLEITVRTADHSHLYTSGIIPPKIPSTPTTDITDEINEREPFDKPQRFRHTPEPYLGDSRYNNEDDDDDDDSDLMFGVREHNRDRLAQRQAESKKMKDFGTQVEEKSTRTIGTMSEPVVTRNAGNEVQPQSSATQTADLFRQSQREEDEIELQQTTSQPFRDDTRTNGYYPSQRSTSVDRRTKNKPYSSTERQHKDQLEHDQYRPRHRSHYRDDPRHQYITPQDDYEPYPSSRPRHRRPSPTSPNHTPPPPAEYRSTSPYRRSRTPSPSDHHRLPPKQRSRSRSPPSQRRPRPAQRSTSPPTSKHHVSSSPRRSPSPRKDDSHRSKHQPQKVSVATDTSLDRTVRRQHQHSQSESPSTREFGTTTTPDLSRRHQKKPSYSDYQKLDSNPPKHQDHTNRTSYEDNYKSSRDNQPPSTRKNYRLRPKANDSYTNNYEEIPSKHDESNSSPKPFTDGRRRPVESPTITRRSDEEQYPKATTNDETPNDNYIQELPSGGSVSIRSTPVIQPDSLPRSRDQKKSPARIPLHHGRQHETPPRRDSSLLNFGTTHVEHQPPMNEVAMPFNVRYLSEPEDEFSTDNFNIRSSTLKRDALRDKANRILLLPVLNSSRTYVFEKQPLPGRQMRQSRTNGNFYLATSPILRSLNSSFHEGDLDFDPITHIDPDNLTEHALRTQVA